MAQDDSELNSINEIYISYLSINPSYYEAFSSLINNVIYKDNDNSFSLQHKLYYGILASSAIGSNMMLEHFKKKYEKYGGDRSWVEEGIKNENIPKRIKGFAKMNDILVHKPWILFWAHFAEFDNGMAFFLFQSAIILTTMHRFVSIISALNVLVENDLKKNLITNMDNNLLEKKQDENIRNKFISNPCKYSDFQQHSEKYLYTDDFDWKTNAKYFFSDYAEKEMEFLEKELKKLDEIPLDEKDEKNIFKKKKEIEKYLGLIFGLKDRNYDYHKTNEIIPKELKIVIKKIACYPDKFHEENLKDLKIDNENLIRLILLVTAIKQKICLTFFARAFDDFINNHNNETNSED